MLGLLNARMQALRRVTRKDWNLGLGNDFPAVHSFVHKMHRAAGNRLARLESLSPRFETREFREQRRVDIDDTPREGPQNWGFQNAHVARQDDKIHSYASQSLNQIFLTLDGETSFETGFLYPCGGNTGIPSHSQNPGINDVRTNDNDAGVEPASPNSFVNGAEVRSFARAEHTEAELMHRGRGSCPSLRGIASDASQ
jgi:hypothetical protein